MRYARMRVEAVVVAIYGLLGVGLGSRPITDNSMLLHLRTGSEIAHGLGIPRRDPYSFTAAGQPWVVQSWLPEWTYGWLLRAGGGALVVQQALLIGAVALLTARLARAGSALRTAVAAGAVVAIASPAWDPRPLLFGLLLFALTVTIVEDGASPWWLVPIGWVWVNSHGSFPLVVAWLGLRALGAWLDGGRVQGRTWPPEVRYVPYLVGGLVLGGVVSPVGPALLTFPATVAAKASSFRSVVEWQSPDFSEPGGLLVLGGLVVTVVILAGTVARARWLDVVPATAFLIAGLTAQRNLPVLAIVLAPALGRALREQRRPASDSAVPVAFAAVIGVAALAFLAGAATGPPVVTTAYPVAAVTWLDEQGLLDRDRRVAHQDIVGNYLEYRFGRDVAVFVDDRVDMYPARIIDDAVTLLRGRPGVFDVLDRHRIDAVLWQRDRGPVAALLASDDWEVGYRDERWLVFVRQLERGSSLSE